MKEEGQFVGNHACIDCPSSDGMSVYRKDDGSHDAYCRAQCEEDEKYKSNNRLAESYLGEELGIEKKTRKIKRRLCSEGSTMTTKKKERSSITQEQRESIENNSSYEGDGYRGIKDIYNKLYRVRYEYDDESGKVIKHHYPVTQIVEGKHTLVGYKTRVIKDKSFKLQGINNKECCFFGQFLCNSGKYLLIGGGEIDALSAYQMLREDQIRRGKGDFPPVDVIASSIGETSAKNQAKNHYEFFDSYDIIVLNLDSDAAGKSAEESLLEVLPLSKVRIMKNPDGCKDANDALLNKKHKEYVRNFYSAKSPQLSGIVSSCNLYDEILEHVRIDKIPLPPFLGKLEKMLAGGLPIPSIVNFVAGSGAGKTTIIQEINYFMAFNSPYMTGILSLECTSGKYGEQLLSRHLGKKISLMNTKEDKIEYLNREDVREAADELFRDENGNPRFYLVDDRGELDSMDNIKKKITQLIRGYGCKCIVLDPVTDLLDSLTNEEQSEFMAFQKKVIAQDEVTFVNICHARKTASGQKSLSKGADITEEDIMGSGSIYRSASLNVILMRDKHNEDAFERNCTKVVLSKNRDVGITGKACEIYYDNDTHTLHDRDEWLKINGGF